jgi:hypothetical protein
MLHFMINNLKSFLTFSQLNLVYKFILYFLFKIGNGIIYTEVQLQKHSGGRYN